MPTVAVLSTGAELVESSHPNSLSYGQVRDANRPALIHALKSHGFNVVDLGIAKDELN